MSFVPSRRELAAANMPDGKVAYFDGSETLVKSFAHAVEPPQIPVNGFAALSDRQPRDFDHQGAAGDGFNAGYLAARLSGTEPAQAASAAHRLAGNIISHPGALLPRAEAAMH